RDHARQRLRAGRDVARRARLHQGDAAGAPSGGPPHAGRADRSVRRPLAAGGGRGVTYDIVFVAASALAIISALGVVLSGNPFHSALSLIMNLVSLATMYLLLQADFLAAAQVIVYAGAVMIMFLFVIAYLGGR